MLLLLLRRLHRHPLPLLLLPRLRPLHLPLPRLLLLPHSNRLT